MKKFVIKIQDFFLDKVMEEPLSNVRYTPATACPNQIAYELERRNTINLVNYRLKRLLLNHENVVLGSWQSV